MPPCWTSRPCAFAHARLHGARCSRACVRWVLIEPAALCPPCPGVQLPGAGQRAEGGIQPHEGESAKHTDQWSRIRRPNLGKVFGACFCWLPQAAVTDPVRLSLC